MPVADVLSRIDQLGSTLGQMGRSAPMRQTTPPPASSSSLASSASAPTMSPDPAAARGGGFVPASSTTSFGDDFAAMMRVLEHVDKLSSTAPGSRQSGGDTASAMQAIAASSSVGSASGTAHTGAEAVEIGKEYLGVPYVWGGNDPAIGLDCSGLTKLVYEQMGVDLPRVAADQAQEGREVPSLDEAEPGDLIVTYEGGHIGIYVGEGQMLHAPRPGRDVTIDPVEHYTDSNGIMTIRRLVDSPSEAAAAAETVSSEAAASRREFEAQAGV